MHVSDAKLNIAERTYMIFEIETFRLLKVGAKIKKDLVSGTCVHL